MARHTISADSTDTWTIFGTHGTWTVDEGAGVYVSDLFTVKVNKSAEYNTIRILGDVVNNNIQGYAFGVNGDHNSFIIGSGAEINGVAGFAGPASDTELINWGAITTIGYGIALAGSVDIENYGSISGFYGVIAKHGSTIFNSADGHIVGWDTAVIFVYDDNSLTNDGVIDGATNAINDDGKRSTIVNNGRIDGNVLLNDGNDYFDTRNGMVQGEVFGGAGNDRFLVSSRNIDIVEGAHQGDDTIKSTVNYTLGDNLERLVLLGRADLHGTGNALDNDIRGNRGNDRLAGMNGDDTMRGGAGHDILIGGAGADTFVFVKGDQFDGITDFTGGTDAIRILDTPFHGFGQLAAHIQQHGDDTWIRLGCGDRIVLSGVDHTVLDKSDFDFSA